MKQIPDTTEAWEAGTLGQDEQFACRADPLDERKLDEAAGLHPISIRLQKSLVADLKAIAKANGIGYQPLIRQVLTRFVAEEK